MEREEHNNADQMRAAGALRADRARVQAGPGSALSTGPGPAQVRSEPGSKPDLSPGPDRVWTEPRFRPSWVRSEPGSRPSLWALGLKLL